MSWSFSPGLVAAFLDRNSLDIGQSAPLNLTHTPDQFYWPDKPTEHSRISQFGMTSEPLTGNLGAELLMLFLEDSHARTYQLQEQGPDWTELVADSGGTWRESLAKFDPDLHSLKTVQLSLIEDSTGCLLTLPRSGLMLDGRCWELPTLARRIKETESGFLPTPVALDAGSGRFNTSPGGKPRPTLALMARKDLWPTPTSTLGTNGGLVTPSKAREGGTLIEALSARTIWPTPTVCGNHNRKGVSSKSGDGLATAVLNRKWPTPTAHNAKECNAKSEAGRNTPTLAAQAGGKLNPQWVEWLMGWPIGHTDLKPLETARSRNVGQLRGESSGVHE